MVGIGEHTKLSVHGATQRVFRQHAFYRELNDSLWVGLLQLFKADGLQVANIASVMAIQLVLGLITSHNHLGRVDNHDVIASIDVRSIDRLCLLYTSDAADE